MKTYLELDAFEVGLLQALMINSINNLPKSFVEKVKKAINQIYLDSGFTKKQVYGKKNDKKKK